MLVRTKLRTLNFKPSEGTDDRPGHPRTSGTLVRTNPLSPRCNRRSNPHFRTRPLLLDHALRI